MKVWIVMLSLFLAVAGLCVWDSIHTNQVFNHMSKESEYIYETLLVDDVNNEELKNKILDLNSFWTKKMDILSLSISRKDLQHVSDYLQYLITSTLNQSQEDAITYSRLLNYNIDGIYEANGISFLNLM